MSELSDTKSLFGSDRNQRRAIEKGFCERRKSCDDIDRAQQEARKKFIRDNDARILAQNLKTGIDRRAGNLYTTVSRRDALSDIS